MGSYFIWSRRNFVTRQTSTKSQQVATSRGQDRNYSQAERLSLQSRHPRTPTAREGSEKNPERRTDVSQTTERETSYNEDEDFSNMWQPTSERLQVCVKYVSRDGGKWAIQLKNTPYSAWLPTWRDTGVLAAAADVLSAQSCLYLTCSTAVVGIKSFSSWYDITQIEDTVLLLAFHRIVNTRLTICYKFILQIPK